MSLQFLRPEWFLMLPVIILLGVLFYRRRLVSKDWAAVIDAALLPHLLTEKNQGGGRWWFWVVLLMVLLAVIALAGPVWSKLPQPVFKQQSALVVALDLSLSMNAQDIKPSRLARARLKLIDLLKLRKEGQTALIAYAASPYTVSPLTDDSDTIQSLVSSLTADIMPAQGSRSDLAVQHAVQLLNNAGQTHGDILLITDGVSEKSANAIRQLKLNNIRVSILSVGTEQGAPIPQQDGGFVKDDAGSIVIAKTSRGVMRQLASDAGGLYQSMKLDDTDVSRMQSLLNNVSLKNENQVTDFKSDRWREEGPWLLLLVIPLGALAFRRGLFLSVFLVLFLLPSVQPVYAEEGWNWQSLWKNQNQRAQQILQQGDSEQAAELFSDEDWKAAAHYKAGEYEKALQQLQSKQTPDAVYNRANALAKLGQLQQALEAYDEALKLDPDNEDAMYNRKLVEDALKQQQQDQSQQGDGEQSDQQQSQENSDQQGEDQKGEDQQGQQSEQESAQSEQNQSEQQRQSEQAQQQNNNQQDSQQAQADQDEQQQQSESEAQKQSEENQQKDNAEDDAQSRPLLSDEEQQQSLTEQAEAQWLRRIPDDPGGLLRNKFKYQYGRERQPTVEKEQW